jgi:hypothetical protein
MKKCSFFYVVTTILAIATGVIAIKQSGHLRKELANTRLELSRSESQNISLLHQTKLKSYEQGYKQSIIDSYDNKNRFMITIDPQSNTKKLWKLEMVEDKKSPGVSPQNKPKEEKCAK